MNACPTLTAPIALHGTVDATAILARKVATIHRIEQSVVGVLVSLGSQSRSRAVTRMIAVHVSETKEHVDRLEHMAILLRYGSEAALAGTGDPTGVEGEAAAPFVTTDHGVLDAAVAIARRQIARSESIRAELVSYGAVRALLDAGLVQQRDRLEALVQASLDRDRHPDVGSSERGMMSAESPHRV